MQCSTMPPFDMLGMVTVIAVLERSLDLFPYHSCSSALYTGQGIVLLTHEAGAGVLTLRTMWWRIGREKPRSGGGVGVRRRDSPQSAGRFHWNSRVNLASHFVRSAEVRSGNRSRRRWHTRGQQALFLGTCAPKREKCLTRRGVSSTRTVSSPPHSQDAKVPPRKVSCRGNKLDETQVGEGVVRQGAGSCAAAARPCDGWFALSPRDTKAIHPWG